jgi:hypothetical protein
MRLHDRNALRVHGTLTIELDDGQEATIGVDLDVSHHDTQWGVDQNYADRERYGSGFSRRPLLPLATTYSIRIPTGSHEGPQFVLTIPNKRDAEA